MFTEVFIFYGLMFSIAAFEIWKAQAVADKTKFSLDKIGSYTKEHNQLFKDLNQEIVKQKD